MPVINNDFQILYITIRNFDTSVKIPREELLEILDKTVTAPSSVNMQPWRFVVVDSEEGKEKLTPFVSYNGVQNETSSAMVLIFADLKSQEELKISTVRLLLKEKCLKKSKKNNCQALCQCMKMLLAK